MLGAEPGGTPLSSPEYAEQGAARRQARAWRDQARKRRVVERQDVVFFCLRHESALHFVQLIRHLGRKVVELGEVLAEVVELPLVPGHHVWWWSAA